MPDSSRAPQKKKEPPPVPAKTYSLKEVGMDIEEVKARNYENSNRSVIIQRSINKKRRILLSAFLWMKFGLPQRERERSISVLGVHCPSLLWMRERKRLQFLFRRFCDGCWWERERERNILVMCFQCPYEGGEHPSFCFWSLLVVVDVREWEMSQFCAASVHDWW